MHFCGESHSSCSLKEQFCCPFLMHFARQQVQMTFFSRKMTFRKEQKNCSFCGESHSSCSQKEQFCCPFLMHFARERYLYFLPCKMQQKRTTKLFLLTTWRMALTTKRAIFCSFLNVIFLEKNVICTCCLAKCIRKGKQILLTTWRMALTTKMHQRRTTKLFLLTTWRMALFTKRAIFGSFLNVIFLEKNVICNFCLAKCIRKGQKIGFC